MDTPTLVWFFLSNDELWLPMNGNWERPAEFEAGDNVKNASPRQHSPAGQQAIPHIMVSGLSCSKRCGKENRSAPGDVVVDEKTCPKGQDASEIALGFPRLTDGAEALGLCDAEDRRICSRSSRRTA